MQVDLSGLRALVTGSTKGIGRAVAETLATNGAEVAINGRKAADVEQAIADIRGMLPKARLVAAPGDVATAEGVAAIIRATGNVDILVNNAGIFEIKDAFEIPDEDWQRLFATNVLSGVRFTRHYGPLMRDKGFGRIVFISSESGVQIPTEMIYYGFTKSADLALMRGFAQALAATGVTVNAVLPGPTRTEGVEAMFRSMGQSLDDPKVERNFIECAADLDHQAVGEGAGGRHGGGVLMFARGERHHRFAHAGRRRCRAVDHLSVKLFWRLARGGWRRDAARIVLVGHAFCDESAARFAGKLLIVSTKLTGCHFGFCADRERRRAGQQRDQQSGNEGISMHRGNSYYRHFTLALIRAAAERSYGHPRQMRASRVMTLSSNGAQRFHICPLLLQSALFSPASRLASPVRPISWSAPSTPRRLLDRGASQCWPPR